MSNYKFSIRTVLLAVTAILTMLIAAQSGYRVYNSWQLHSEAETLQQVSTVMNHLFSAEKFLSLERGAATAVVYLPPQAAESLRQDLKMHQAEADKELETAMDLLQEEDIENLSYTIDRVRTNYLNLQKLRKQMTPERKLSRPEVTRLSNQLFKVSTTLIESIHKLTEEYSAPYLVMNPAVVRQIRFSNIIWSITEYAGREYTRFGQLIAENARPTQKELEELSLWRGRVQYGWELAHSVIESSDWARRVKPAMEEAETHYFVTFDQIKDMFYATARGPRHTTYPMTIDVWLELASQAVDSLHSMSDAVLEVNEIYSEKAKSDAERAIIFSLLMFVSALLLSSYSWWVINHRVIGPVNDMVDSLYKATHIDNYPLPEDEDEIGKLSNILLVFQENSRQLEIERDKAQAANIAKSEFLANMSHEIRTPMNVILGLSNILANSQPLTEKQAEYVRTLRLSGEALLSIINDVLDFSKLETRNFELEHIPFSLATVAEEVCTQMQVNAQQKKLAFKLGVKDVQDREYIGDPTRIRQMLTNLCSNAIKFTEKGHVAVEVRSDGMADHDHETIILSVTDTGIGIPADKLEYIFDKFTQADSTITRKFGGTGLGLAITKAFAEMMDGSIRVESVHGEGSSFIITVPLQLSHETPPQYKESDRVETAADRKDGDAAGVRVLLVEDYQPNALVAEAYLQEFGYAYDLAVDGRQAVEMVKDNPYDIVLMDVQMHEMDGYQATRAIRQLEHDTGRRPCRIIGMTAYALIGDREKCLEAGMDDYLSKPFTPEALREAIRRLTAA